MIVYEGVLDWETIVFTFCFLLEIKCNIVFVFAYNSDLTKSYFQKN